MVYLYEYSSLLSLALVSNLAYVLYIARSEHRKGKTFFDLLSRHTEKHLIDITAKETAELRTLRLFHSELEYKLSGGCTDGQEHTLRLLDERINKVEREAGSITRIIKDRADNITQFYYHSRLSLWAVIFSGFLLILAPWSQHEHDFTQLFLICGWLFGVVVLYAAFSECHTIRSWNPKVKTACAIFYWGLILLMSYIFYKILPPIESDVTRAITTYFCLCVAFSNFIVYFAMCKVRLYKLSKRVYPRKLKALDVQKTVEFCQEIADQITPTETTSYQANQTDINTQCS